MVSPEVAPAAPGAAEEPAEEPRLSSAQALRGERGFGVRVMPMLRSAAIQLPATGLTGTMGLLGGRWLAHPSTLGPGAYWDEISPSAIAVVRE